MPLICGNCRTDVTDQETCPKCGRTVDPTTTYSQASVLATQEDLKPSDSISYSLKDEPAPRRSRRKSQT